MGLQNSVQLQSPVDDKDFAMHFSSLIQIKKKKASMFKTAKAIACVTQIEATRQKEMVSCLKKICSMIG